MAALRRQGEPGRRWAANLTCRLFIRRTSSRKSRDSMVGPARAGTPAGEKERWDRWTKRLASEGQTHTGQDPASPSLPLPGRDRERPAPSLRGGTGSGPPLPCGERTKGLANFLIWPPGLASLWEDYLFRTSPAEKPPETTSVLTPPLPRLLAEASTRGAWRGGHRLTSRRRSLVPVWPIGSHVSGN